MQTTVTDRRHSDLDQPSALDSAMRPAPSVQIAVDDETTGPCPNCDAPMHAIRGSKRAVCANCGFKDSCCF